MVLSTVTSPSADVLAVVEPPAAGAPVAGSTIRWLPTCSVAFVSAAKTMDGIVVTSIAIARITASNALHFFFITRKLLSLNGPI